MSKNVLKVNDENFKAVEEYAVDHECNLSEAADKLLKTALGRIKALQQYAGSRVKVPKKKAVKKVAKKKALKKKAIKKVAKKKAPKKKALKKKALKKKAPKRVARAGSDLKAPKTPKKRRTSLEVATAEAEQAELKSQKAQKEADQAQADCDEADRAAE